MLPEGTFVFQLTPSQGFSKDLLPLADKEIGCACSRGGATLRVRSPEAVSKQARERKKESTMLLSLASGTHNRWGRTCTSARGSPPSP